MRRLGFAGCDLSKVFGWCLSAKGLVRPEGVELVGEGIDPSVDVVEVVGGQFPSGVKLVASGPVVALDMAIEFGRAGRQLVERDAAARTFGFEVGL